MYFAAQLTRKLKHLFAILVLFSLLSNLIPPLAQAQTVTPSSVSSLSENLAPGIPLNQHTYVQTVFLEMTDAFICQLTGQDILSPQTGCLDVNPITHKIGYAPKNDKNTSQGILGFAVNAISILYTPPARTSDYVRYLADNFGLVKTTYAATNTDGLKALSSVVNLWIICRNIAYTIFVIAFVFIGIGVMLRIKIDPRTVIHG